MLYGSSAVTADLNITLYRVKSAIRAGEKDAARELLQDVARLHSGDLRVWLWLAALARSQQESLDYIAQAERIAPNDPRVVKARSWTATHFAA